MLSACDMPDTALGYNLIYSQGVIYVFKKRICWNPIINVFNCHELNPSPLAKWEREKGKPKEGEEKMTLQSDFALCSPEGSSVQDLVWRGRCRLALSSTSLFLCSSQRVGITPGWGQVRRLKMHFFFPHTHDRPLKAKSLNLQLKKYKPLNDGHLKWRSFSRVILNTVDFSVMVWLQNLPFTLTPPPSTRTLLAWRHYSTCCTEYKCPSWENYSVAASRH